MTSFPGEVVSCGVSAFGAVRAPLAVIPALRKDPGPTVRGPLPFSLLKHADEQTVAGVAAVLHAIRDFDLREQSFAGWGVLGAPRFPGRLVIPEQIRCYRAEGSLGVSPHTISNRSTHALSGTISLALQLRGTNFGVGGGEGALIEGLLAALTLLDGGQLPGLWLALTEWDPEPLPDGRGPTPDEAICHAVALALALVPSRRAVQRLRLLPASASAEADPTPPTVASLADFLTGGRDPHWRCPLDWGAMLELEQTPQPAEGSL